MTLKIAFLISGEARNYIYTTFSFKKFVFNYCKSADIYISFKKNSRIHYAKKDIDKKIIKKYQIPIDDIIKDEVYLSSMFGEKLKYFGYDNEVYINKIVEDKYNSIDNEFKKYVSIPTLDQYARVKNIAEIFEAETNKKDIKYDIVVRLRLDRLWWVTKLDIEKYIIDKNKIYFSYINWKKSKFNRLPNWIQDFFFMGNSDLILYIIKDFFNNLYTSKEYLEENENNNAPELQLGNYINSNINLKNNIEYTNINKNLCALLIERPLYLKGYLVGTYKDVLKYYKLYNNK